MNKSKFARIFLLLTALGALLLNACAGSSVPAAGSTEATEPAQQPVTEPDLTEIRIAVLNGTTGFGIAPLAQKLKNEGSDVLRAKIDYYADATLVSPLIISGNADIAAVPTNLAPVLYNKTEGKVQVIGINTLGVLYVTERTGGGADALAGLESLAGKNVCVPGQGTNPEYILQALLTKAGLRDKVTPDYTYANPDELTAAVGTGSVGLALLPEPKVTVAMNKFAAGAASANPNSQLIRSLDISSEWKRLMGCDLVQGCFVVRREFADSHPEAVIAFLSEYADCLRQSDEKIADAIVAEGLIADRKTVLAALPGCNLVAMSGREMMKPLNTYWKALFDIVPSSVGGRLPDDGIFRVFDR